MKEEDKKLINELYEAHETVAKELKLFIDEVIDRVTSDIRPLGVSIGVEALMKCLLDRMLIMVGDGPDANEKIKRFICNYVDKSIITIKVEGN